MRSIVPLPPVDLSKVSWRRAPLSSAELARVHATRWRRLSAEEAIVVAEGWNAGVTTAAMAAVFGRTPATYRVLIGKLSQLGVKMRSADAERRERMALRAQGARERADRLQLKPFPTFSRARPY